MIDREEFKKLVSMLAATSAAVFSWAGCSSSDSGGGKGNGCTPGDTKTCACPSGKSGAQTCKSDGSGYGTCEGCGASADGGASTGGSHATGGASGAGGATNGTGGTGNTGGAAGSGGTTATGGVPGSGAASGGPSTTDAGVPGPSDGGGSACGPCAGCCDSTGTCVAPQSQSAAQCGLNAATCIACNAGDVCVSGQCVTASGCSPTGCPTGCCDEGACILPELQNFNACGGAGLACGVCDWGVTCQAGTCTTEIDPNAQFYLVVDEVKVSEKDESGNAWDPAGGLPDPFACFSDGIASGCTSALQDTTGAVWAPAAYVSDSSGKPLLFSGNQILSGALQFSVYDEDLASNDLIQSGGYVSGIAQKQATYEINAFGNVIHLRWHLAP